MFVSFLIEYWKPQIGPLRILIGGDEETKIMMFACRKVIVLPKHSGKYDSASKSNWNESQNAVGWINFCKKSHIESKPQLFAYLALITE